MQCRVTNVVLYSTKEYPRLAHRGLTRFLKKEVCADHDLRRLFITEVLENGSIME